MLNSLAKWVSVCLQTKWLWIRVPLQSLKSRFFCSSFALTMMKNKIVFHVSVLSLSPSLAISVCNINSKTYSIPCQTTIRECLGENGYQHLGNNYLHKNALSQLFDKILSTPLYSPMICFW